MVGRPIGVVDEATRTSTGMLQLASVVLAIIFIAVWMTDRPSSSPLARLITTMMNAVWLQPLRRSSAIQGVVLETVAEHFSGQSTIGATIGSIATQFFGGFFICPACTCAASAWQSATVRDVAGGAAADGRIMEPSASGPGFAAPGWTDGDADGVNEYACEGADGAA